MRRGTRSATRHCLKSVLAITVLGLGCGPSGAGRSESEVWLRGGSLGRDDASPRGDLGLALRQDEAAVVWEDAEDADRAIREGRGMGSEIIVWRTKDTEVSRLFSVGGDQVGSGLIAGRSRAILGRSLAHRVRALALQSFDRIEVVWFDVEPRSAVVCGADGLLLWLPRGIAAQASAGPGRKADRKRLGRVLADLSRVPDSAFEFAPGTSHVRVVLCRGGKPGPTWDLSFAQPWSALRSQLGNDLGLLLDEALAAANALRRARADWLGRAEAPPSELGGR